MTAHNLTTILRRAVVGLGMLIATAGLTAAQTFEDPVIGEKGYHVGSYGDGAYWVTEGGYNSMFVVYEDGVVVVDAPPSYAKKLPEAIASVTDKPVTHFIYSHYHKDHNGAAAVFGDDVTYIGHARTSQELNRIGDPNRPVPTVTFEDSYALDVGSQRIELSYSGLNHTPGNIIIYLPNQKILMLVDVIFPDLVPFARLAIAAHVPGYYGVIEAALEYDFEVFQGGHRARPGTREEFMVVRDYVLDLRNSVYAALGMVQPPMQFIMQDSPVNAHTYHAFTQYIETVSATCAEILVQNWAGKLDGIYTFVLGHCESATMEAMVD